MAKLQFLAALGLFAYNVANAEPVPEPMITAAPLVKRAGTLVGWVNQGVLGDSTSWAQNTCKAGYTFTSASNYFKCCPTSSACNLYTSCSGGRYLIGPGTTADCSSASLPFCSSDLLFPSLGAISPQTYFWCGTTGDTGTNIYRVSPPATGGDSIIDTSSSRSSSRSSPSSTPLPNVTAAPKKSTPIGAIVGGVIGGLAVIGLAVAGVVLILMRRKKNTSTPVAQEQQPYAGGAAAVGQDMNGGAGGAASGYYGAQEKVGMASPPVGQMPYMAAQSPPPQYPSGIPQQPYGQDPYYQQQAYGQPMNPHQSVYGEMQQKGMPMQGPNTVELDTGAPITTPPPQSGHPNSGAVELETPPAGPYPAQPGQQPGPTR